MKKLMLLLTIVMTSQLLHAQDKLPRKYFEAGILMGLDLGYLKTETTDWEATGLSTDLRNLDTQNKLGFNVGIIARLNLTNQFAFVPQAIISFHNSQLVYDLENQTNHTETIEPAMVEFPLHFVFTNDKLGKFNYSVLLGGRYRYDLTEQTDEAKLDLVNHDFAIDLGTGMEIKFEKFKVKPELIYSLGLVNLKNSQSPDDVYHSAIESIHRDQISFRLVFYN